MVRPLAGLYARVRHHGPELAKFGIVGGLGTIIDLGGAAVLHSAYHEGPLASKAISFTAATVFTYVGSRFWTFRHRENQPVHREALLFVALNAVGLVIAELVIAGTTYGLGLKGPLAYNAASFIGTGLGTVFRWYAYRKWVFLAPAQQPSPWSAAAADYPHYAQWEPRPAYRGAAYPAYQEPEYSAYQEPAYSAYQEPAYSGYPAYPAARRPLRDPAGRPPQSPRVSTLETPFIPNESVASPLATAAAPAGQAVRSAASPAPVPGTHRAPGRHRRTR